MISVKILHSVSSILGFGDIIPGQYWVKWTGVNNRKFLKWRIMSFYWSVDKYYRYSHNHIFVIQKTQTHVIDIRIFVSTVPDRYFDTISKSNDTKKKLISKLIGIL